MRLPAAAAVLLLAPAVWAQDLKEELDVHADEVTLDVRMRELELKGHVRADAPPFHLSADRLTLQRTSHGIVIDGDGKLTFCPCLGTPLALGFKSVTVAPPADLFVTSPRLEIFHVPIFWLPWFWLRAPSRVGLLPPEISWRGVDGLFLGEGVHLPWRTRTGKENVVDLRVGAYVLGGVAVDAIARTETTATHVRFDHLDPQTKTTGAQVPDAADGLLVDARGVLDRPIGALRARVAWDFDLLRGARGVYATTELDPAARPFDVGSAETAVDVSSFVFATGVRAAAVRGGDFLAVDAAGPYVTVSHDAALGSVGTYDATVDGSVLHETGGSVAFAHGDVGVLLAGHASWVGLRASVRGFFDAASDATQTGAIASVLGRAEATLPFARGFGRGDALRHRIEPVVAVSALARDEGGPIADIAARTGAFLSSAAFGGSSGEAALGIAGFRTSVARWGRGDGLELEAHGGALVDAGGTARGIVRWRALAGAGPFGLSGEGAHVFSAMAGGGGDAFVLRARIGESERTRRGPVVTAHVAARDGIDPIEARLATDASLEPASGLLALTGVSGGVRASVPWTRWLTTRGGVEMDLTTPVLTAALGSIELRDTCGCFRLGLHASHRLGRDGVDVWATVELR